MHEVEVNLSIEHGLLPRKNLLYIVNSFSLVTYFTRLLIGKLINLFSCSRKVTALEGNLQR